MYERVTAEPELSWKNCARKAAGLAPVRLLLLTAVIVREYRI